LREYYSVGLLLSMIHAQHFPLETLYKAGRFKVEDFRKKSLFPPNPADHEANLVFSPTNVHFSQVYTTDDYE